MLPLDSKTFAVIPNAPDDSFLVTRRPRDWVAPKIIFVAHDSKLVLFTLNHIDDQIDQMFYYYSPRANDVFPADVTLLVVAEDEEA